MHDMTTTLSTIPWHTISGQIENCGSIPQAILSLANSDPHLRKQAYWKIDNHVVVQGGLYEGAFYVIPFLLWGATSRLFNGRVESMKLLFEIASGAASFTQTVSFRTKLCPFVHFVPDAAGTCAPLCIAVRFAVAGGLEKLIDVLFAEESTERKSARDLIALFPEYAYALSERIQDIATSNSNATIKNEINGLMREIRN